MRLLLLVVLNGILALVLIGGCSSDPGPVTAGDPAQVASPGFSWPPPPVQARQPSDGGITLDGVDYTWKGGSTSEEGTELVLSGHDDQPFGIYVFSNLGEENELVSVACSYTESPIRPDDGTRLFFAMANYQKREWEWIEFPLSGSLWFPAEYQADDYRSEDGVAYFAVTLAGPGKGRIESVTFTSVGGEIYISNPRNLTAVCEASRQVLLNWEGVENAEGYNVYRSRDPEFSSQAKINTGLVHDTEYTDNIDTTGEYFFYRVTAVAGQESHQSNTAGTWCMGIDLPAPSDLLVINREEDNFSAGWDWVHPSMDDPYSFTLFLDTTPNFTLESETLNDFSVYGGARLNTFHDIEKGIVYYWKLCASDSAGNLGRISEELSGTVIDYWTWSEADTISAGQAPVRVISDGGRIALAYFDDYRVMFAIQSGDTWTVECVMDQYLDHAPSFKSFVDLSYSNGRYFLASQAIAAGDCWFAEWDSSEITNDWITTRIHGDGEKLHISPKSGYYLGVVSDDTEVAVVQYFLTDFSLLLHTRPVTGGPWTTEVLRTGFTPGCTPSTSAHYLDGDLFILSTDDYSDQLLLANRAGGWSWQEVREAGVPKLSKHLDLQRFMGEWISPVQLATEKDLYLIHGNTLPWAADPFPTIDEDSGHYARMAVDGDEAFVIEYFDEYYNYALYSENWNLGPVIVPGVEQYIADADGTLLDQMPYLAFEDKLTMEIKVAWGVPPVE